MIDCNNVHWKDLENTVWNTLEQSTTRDLREMIAIGSSTMARTVVRELRVYIKDAVTDGRRVK